MIRIAIVDDERTILDHLREKVSNTANELSIDHTIETFLNGADLLQRNKEVSFHIIFLDLEMPDPDGLSTAQQLREASPDVALIFITNRSDLVFRAFAYDVIGFVRKSHIEEELRPTLDRAYQKVLMRMANYIFRTEQGERIFPSDSICYFVSHKHKVFLCDETKEMTRVMTTLEKLGTFCRLAAL